MRVIIAQDHPPVTFEDIPLDEARRLHIGVAISPISRFDKKDNDVSRKGFLWDVVNEVKNYSPYHPETTIPTLMARL